jgi:hypothetical protein
MPVMDNRAQEWPTVVIGQRPQYSPFSLVGIVLALSIRAAVAVGVLLSDFEWDVGLWLSRNLMLCTGRQNTRRWPVGYERRLRRCGGPYGGRALD